MQIDQTEYQPPFTITELFEESVDHLQDELIRILVFEGGARSSKTWTILELILTICLARTNKWKGWEKWYQPEHGYKITICRKKLTWLKATVLLDFQELIQMKTNLHEYITPELNINRPEQTYSFNGSQISFIGLDEKMKLHGRKQDIFWGNEAMEMDLNDHRQLSIRTSKLFIYDYNPSTSEHWIYDTVIPRKDSVWIHSTVAKNQYLDINVYKEILMLRPSPENIAIGTADETLWKIYGLGQRADIKGLIFPNVKIVKEFPSAGKHEGFGLDFGYINDVTALMHCCVHNGEIYIDEWMYEAGLVNIRNPKNPQQKSIQQRFEELNVSSNRLIIADKSEQKSIAELKGCRYNIHRSITTTVKKGLEVLQRYNINITERSVNLLKEQRNYKWQEHRTEDGKLINEPVDAFNHGWDAVRYWAERNLAKRRKIY